MTHIKRPASMQASSISAVLLVTLALCSRHSVTRAYELGRRPLLPSSSPTKLRPSSESTADVSFQSRENQSIEQQYRSNSPRKGNGRSQQGESSHNHESWKKVSENVQNKSSAREVGYVEDTRHYLTTKKDKFARRYVRQVARDGEQRSCNLTQRMPAIYGIRCDGGGPVDDGILVIKANEPTQVLLIGQHLDANISVALTPERHDARADCTHADRVKSIGFTNISSNIAQVLIDVPASMGPRRPFYLCLRDAQGHWHHQGPDAWLKLYVDEDLLPVYMKIVMVACLLMLSGLFSGLNLGLMALDKNELQVIISCGTDKEKRYARAIEPVRRRGNYLLCSILFSNVLVNSTIAVLLEELTSGIVAVMTSTIFIVMFGEILPQAFCSRHGLAVGAKTVSITYFCMIVTFPLSYPVSSCLDWALGEEIGHAYDRERLMEFIRVTRDYNNLETDEVNIISGALKLKKIQLSEVMTRIEDVYMLDMNSCLDFDTIQAIIERGYSRIPVHEPGNKKNIVALLFAKDLALLDPDDRTPVQTLISFYNHPIMFMFEDTTLDLALNEFKTGKSHMAFIRRVIDDGDRDPVYEITGIVTLEDVIEEIMQMEINDETDTLSDNKRKRRRNEAQVRRDFSQFTGANFGAGDAGHNVVTPQLCLAAYQYLATTVEAFSSKYISDAVLKRLLSRRVYFKVRVTADEENRAAGGGNNSRKTIERRLYTAGEPADYFIMILEGRVNVVCGKENLVFEGGPFSYFGKAALTAASSGDKLPDSPMITSNSVVPAHQHHQRPSLVELSQEQRTQLRDNVVELKRFGSASYKRLASGGGGGGGGGDGGGGEQTSEQELSSLLHSSQNNSTLAPLGFSAAASRSNRESRLVKTSGSRSSISSIERPSVATAAAILPDYTVEIVCDTSYLKITRHEYQAALRATLVERGSAMAIADEDNASLEERNVQEQPTGDELSSGPLMKAAK